MYCRVCGDELEGDELYLCQACLEESDERDRRHEYDEAEHMGGIVGPYGDEDEEYDW